jgi:YebC/PmpR family DNA-binding regulatory protein
MSGHSKWSTIKRQKEATDKQRGKIFTKLGRAISVAVREGGGVTDAEMNFKLRLAIEKARQSNMPKANIERAIASGVGGAGGQGWEEVMYEGFGPAGVAIVAKVVTDNRNRALGEIKQIFDKGGGNLGQSGSVSFMFDQVGWLLIESSDKEVDELMLQLMDVDGISDVSAKQNGDDGVDVFTQAGDLKKVEDQLSEEGLQVKEAELIMKPKAVKELSDEDQDKVVKFVAKLEESDEVQQVFSDMSLDT